MKNYVSVKNLVKHYGDVCAVDNLSFHVGEGEIFGLIGPNGAGKSTTINIITTLDSYTKGTVEIAGMNIESHAAEIKKLIGVVPQEIAVYPHLNALENVKFFASLYGLKGAELDRAAREALAFVGLSEKLKMKPKQMSGGMKRRLNIACGIAHDPKLIIMDEPTVGVDAQSRDHTYYNRAQIILSRKDIINPDIFKAISDLEKAIELDPKFVDALFALAAAYKKLADYHKALEYIEKLLQIEPDAIMAKALKKLILQKYML